jgi:hypothetical protein
MGAVYEEFQRDLAAWQTRYAGRPRQEMIHLFLLALEREELVSLAYREAAIVRRLADMPLSPEVRDLIHHALIWVWKDEEMHSIYIRGAILKIGSLSLKVTAFLRQFAGAIGGWSSSVQQHARWGQAPLSRTLAAVNTWVGSLLGKVPRDVKQHLRYGPFRDFCLFNIDAEDTARVCWQRLVELASSQPGVSPHLVEDFRHIRDDEERHGRIFRILAGALDETDHLVPGETARTLVHRIRDVGEFFLPRAYRRSREAINPLAAGGQVYALQGQTPQDKVPLFRRLLDDLDVGRLLRERAAVLGKPVAELRVAVKTRSSATTTRTHRTSPTRSWSRSWPVTCARRVWVMWPCLRHRIFTTSFITEGGCATLRSISASARRTTASWIWARSRCRTATTAAWRSTQWASPGRTPTTASPSARCAATRSSWCS